MGNDAKLIVLGAGRPHIGQTPSVLTDAKVDTSLLQWQINAANQAISDTIFIGGFRVDEVRNRYSDLKIIENHDWLETGPSHSLMLAPLDKEKSWLISYGDILFRSWVCKRLTAGSSDIAIAYDSAKISENVNLADGFQQPRECIAVEGSKVMFLGRDIPRKLISGEFIGLVHFNEKAVNFLLEMRQHFADDLKTLGMSELIEYMRCRGLSVEGIDVAGDWAEFKKGDEIASFVLGTKAETLSRLRGIIKAASIQDQICFTQSNWRRTPKEIITRITKRFGPQKLIVRSSARSEDSFSASNAGGYESVLNVESETELIHAIDKVFHSYGASAVDNDQVLIQPMLQDVMISGVVFTQTLDHAAPWYVINYETNGDTAAITSGASGDHETLYVRRSFEKLAKLNPTFSNLLVAVKEIETLLGHNALDIEFAATSNNQIHILQVRPIVNNGSKAEFISHDHYDIFMDKAREKFLNLETSAPHIPANLVPLFGNMPDWNPAEILGTSPNALATSLYKFLIMDETWALQRAQYGYRDVRPANLLISFAGQPYVDVRLSFASFIPESLNENLSSKLLNFYLSWLNNRPELHDKVEFDVVPTCFTANFDQWSNRLREHGAFNVQEIEALRIALKKITQTAFGRVANDLVQIQNLQERFAKLISEERISKLSKISMILDDCRRFGTLAFAHLARSGFVAMNLLKDAVSVGIISVTAYEDFLRTVATVSHDLNISANKVAIDENYWDEFVEKFGHLRPGTYDITSPRYSDNPDFFLRPLVTQDRGHFQSVQCEHSNWEIEKEKFFSSLRQLDLPSNEREVEAFLRMAIEGREYAKFIFTRSLSLALEYIAEVGGTLGLARADVENLQLDDILSIDVFSFNKEKMIEILKLKINEQKLNRYISLGCKLPPLISSVDDFDFFTLTASVPNFIGSKDITAVCVELSGPHNEKLNVAGNVVLIPQADPGYDWLFSKNIAGLITMHGGANSHMAIRSAEFGLPAAIGVGEQMYNELSRANLIELSPGQSSIRIIR